MFEFTTKLMNQTVRDLKEVVPAINIDQLDRFKNKFTTTPIMVDNDLTFEDYLPFGDCDAESVFDNRTCYSFILRVSPFSGIDQRAVNSLTQIISYEIPAEAVVQVINFASPKIDDIISSWKSACSKDASQIYHYLSNKRSEFYLNSKQKGLWGNSNDLALRNFELYFSISFTKKESKQSNLDLIEQIIEVRKKTIKALNNASCYCEALNRRGFECLLEQLTLPSSSNDNRTKEECNYEIHPNYFELTTDNKNISSCKYLLFEVVQWPESWSITSSANYVGNFSTGKGLNFPFYISYGFKPFDQAESERRATKTRILKINQTSSKLATFFPAMIEEIEDWQYVSGKIASGERLTSVVMYIVVMTGELVDYKNAETAVKDHFYQLGFKINQIKYDLVNNFIASLPMSMAEHWKIFSRQKTTSTLLTNNCTSLLPIFADCQNFNSPLLMLVGRRGQVFFFDNYESTENGNFNMIVVGKSGSGKSVFLQEYMTSILRLGGQVVVIDDGRSFQNSCDILGGDFIDFGQDRICINPFSLYQDNEKKDEKFRVDFEEPLIDLIVSILCIITNIDKNNTKNFDTGLYRDILRKAVQVVLETKGSGGGFADVWEALKISSKVRTKQTEELADKLHYILTEYGVGRHAGYYNGIASLSIKNLLTVFELSNLESNEVLQTSVLLMVIFLVYIKMQSREKRTSLIIDEAWRLLRHDAIKGFIEGIARRARKYNGNLVVATQNISDFEENKSAAAAAVLSQSDWRVLLSAEGKDERILNEQLGMSNAEVEIAKNLRGDKGRYSEAMIRHSSGSWLIGRLILDSFSAKLYSSKASDVIAIKNMQKQGKTIEQAIESLLENNGYEEKKI